MVLIFLILAVSILLPCSFVFLECLASFFSHSFSKKTREKSPTEVSILVPAHNEATGLEETLKALLSQVSEAKNIIVIADNCSDDTAEIARQFQVTVLERQDSDLRGKGYALDYGLNFLQVNPPEVVIFVDADCLVEPEAIALLSQEAFTQNKPIQALYLLEKPPHPTPKDLISALAFLVKNLVRPAGLARLGYPCLLTGTGMAFPWEIIRDIPLASGNIVEDMQLGIDLALRGFPPLFCQEAKVMGVLPKGEKAATSQRTRWEHGHLQTLLTQVPRLLKGAIFQKRFELFILALELAIPPLSLLVMLWGVAMLVTFLCGFFAISWLPAILTAIAGFFLLTGIFGAWFKFGRQDIPGSALIMIPFYLLWKIPLYLGFLIRPQKQWVRTERN